MHTSRKSLIPFSIIILVLMVSLACGSSTPTTAPAASNPTEASNVSNPQATNPPQNTEPPKNTEPPPPTQTPKPTPVPPTPTTAPIGVSRSNPYPKTELVTAQNWDIQVVDMVRGDEAWQSVLAANQFNDPAPDGMEYLLVKIHAKCTYADSDEHMISGSDFNLTGDRLIQYSNAYAVDPEPQLDATLYADGETEGWTSFLVGQGEGNLILIFDEIANWNEDRYQFIALDDGASISVSTDIADIKPTDLGTNRSQPAAMGETVTTEDWKVSILEVVRGEEAWAMAQEANQFNDPPADGMEYVAFRVHAQNIGTKDRAEQIDGTWFDTTGSANVIYDNPYVVEPEPALNAYLYPGGETEGWVILQVASGETNIMAIFQPLFSFSSADKRFMSLEG